MTRWHVYAVLVFCIISSLITLADSRKNHRKMKQIRDLSGNITAVSTTEKNEFGGETTSSKWSRRNYSPWTKWSRCTRRCRQRRRRLCLRPSACGTNMLTEQRACSEGRCLEPKNPPKSEDVSKEQEKNKPKKEDEDEFRILYHLADPPSPYSKWSEWEKCSPSSCQTRRTRVCRMPDVCGTNVLEEISLCYAEGSHCEKLYGMKKKKKKSAHDNATGVALMRHNPLEGLTCGVAPITFASIPDLWNKLRIIGGREAKRGSWPWQLTLLNKYREPFCGGTLVSPGWVLTAAHCLRRRLYVRSGEHSLMSVEGTEQESSIASQHPHPDYDPDTVSNDIALLRLKIPFTLDNHTQPACVPAGDGEDTIGEKGVILGWGKRRSTAIYGTDNLHQAEVPVVALSECRASYDTFPINERMLCAGYKAGRVDSCAGDSGGPLLARRSQDDHWTVYGITSFGDGCGEKGKFGIYSDVSKYVKWIKNTVARHSR